MTNDEKAKAYDMALEAARKELGVDRKEWEAVEHVLHNIFPQLRESEDERIRKELVNFLQSPFIKENLTDEKVAPWLAWLEKQKEQNGEDEECTDFTIYHPLKNGKGEYKCIPYSFYGLLTSFSEDKDLIDFLRTCFYTEEECEAWIEKQKEQKPAEWEDYKDKVNIPYCSSEPEWSEEDADMLNCCISSIEEAKENRYAYKETDGDTSYDREIAWLKSLRPSWKPSDEQMKALEVSFRKDGDDNYRNAINSLYNDLKKL